ncbi:hypothetical protein MMC16_002906 [Acarospora aff. strigata]|nr:hypothetical protein [Acarospora aff. strigata]
MFAPPTLDSLIGSSSSEKRTCMAITKKGFPCTNPIAKKNVEKALAYIETTSVHHHCTSGGQADLRWLAGLLLCRHDHQSFDYEVMQTWRDQARHALPSNSPASAAVPEEKLDLPVKDLITLGPAKSSLRTKYILKDAQPIARKTSNVRTRSMGSPDTVSVESPPEFIEARRAKRSLPAVNADVFKIILNLDKRTKPGQRLTKRDMKDGYIYPFTRASSPGYVKIGVTTRTVDERLQEWSRQCKYVPHNETRNEKRMIPNAHQIERLILAELALYRRKESVCNGGAGCPKKHKEWVEVGIDLALEVIDRWCSWAEKKPYDDDGVLKEEWRAHTKVSVRAALIDEQDQGNRWQEWMDSLPQSQPVVLSKPDQHAAPSDKYEVQKMSPGLKPSAKNPITKTEGMRQPMRHKSSIPLSTRLESLNSVRPSILVSA